MYSLLLYLDSFLFEIQTFDKTLLDFFCGTLQLLRIESPSSKYVALRNQCGGVREEEAKEFLSKARNKLAHHSAPWIAIDTTRCELGVYDFVLMFKNIHDFSDASPDDYFLVNRDFNSLWSAYQVLADAVEQYLVHCIQKATPENK